MLAPDPNFGFLRLPDGPFMLLGVLDVSSITSFKQTYIGVY